MSLYDEREQNPVTSDVPPDFEQVFAQVGAPLRAYLRRSTTEHDADDLFQETMIRFLESPRAQTLDMAASRKYLFTIASNLLRDHWRKKKRSDKFTRKLQNQAPKWVNTEATLGMQMEVEQALESLSERERAMLWLAYAENYTHREIASALGLRAGSVRVLLFRARRKLTSSFKSRKES